MNFIYVSLGGALGAAARYAVSIIPINTSFPILTLLTNFFGAFLIGIIAGAAEAKNMPPNTVLFLKTGVCGGFTTFSTFSLETLILFEGGHIFAASAYAVCSVLLCLLGVYAGRSLAALI